MSSRSTKRIPSGRLAARSHREQAIARTQRSDVRPVCSSRRNRYDIPAQRDGDSPDTRLFPPRPVCPPLAGLCPGLRRGATAYRWLTPASLERDVLHVLGINNSSRLRVCALGVLLCGLGDFCGESVQFEVSVADLAAARAESAAESWHRSAGSRQSRFRFRESRGLRRGR